MGMNFFAFFILKYLLNSGNIRNFAPQTFAKKCGIRVTCWFLISKIYV